MIAQSAARLPHTLVPYSAAMQFELLDALSPSEQRAVLARMGRRSFRKGETLFHEGDPGDSLHLVGGTWPSGPAPRDGDVVTVVVLGPGASFGEQALLGRLRAHGQRCRPRPRRDAHAASARPCHCGRRIRGSTASSSTCSQPRSAA